VIKADIKIDDLIRCYPNAVGFLIKKGLPCVVCGEPFWGTLAELAQQKGFNEEQINALVIEFNQLQK
jgi:Ni,Fe-hydrogenase I small subunit